MKTVGRVEADKGQPQQQQQRAEMYQKLGIIFAVTLLFNVISCSLALETRADPTPTKAPKMKNINDGCGTLDDLAKKVEVCAKPLMDILQGSVEKWPRTDDDAANLCNQFIGSERCIREVSRKCAKGIQKTIISTLANSIQRVRKRECSPRTKLPTILKTVMCVEKNQVSMHNWMANVTGRLDTIEKQFTDPDKKLMGVCCMIGDIEKEIVHIFKPSCPNENTVIVRLYRSVLEDVIELICRSPKCDNYLKGYKSPVMKDFSGIIAVILRIVFSLDL